MADFIPKRLGWHPDLPDFRDYSPQSLEITQLFEGLGLSTAKVRPDIDLREFFPAVRPLGGLHLNDSCAQACVSLLQYFHRRALGQSIEPSVLFLDQVARRIAAAQDLNGTDLRSHLRAILTFGIPPDRLWRYEHENVHREPAAALYSFAEQYRSLLYLRLDARNGSGLETLNVVKSFLAAGIPSVLGFAVPNSLTTDGDITYHPRFSFVRGGVALVAVGYDDHRLRGTRGALLIRSCWGESWGEAGYGWLPYAFVEQQLATCFWTLICKDWLESGEFRIPQIVQRNLSCA